MTYLIKKVRKISNRLGGVSNEKFSLKLQSRCKNINLDNKTRLSYPEGYRCRDYLRTRFSEMQRRASNSNDFKNPTLEAVS
jgi:hypothetical protein